MTDERASNRSAQGGRARARREPATLDLKAASVVDETPPANAEPDPGPAAGAETPGSAGAPDGGAAGQAPGSASASNRPRRPEARPGLSTGLLAAVAGAGGLLGAAVALVLHPFFLPTDDTAARLAVVERSMAGAAQHGDLDALDKRVTALSRDVKALAEQLAAVDKKADAAQRAAASPPGADPQQLAALSRRLDSLETALKALDPGRVAGSAQELRDLAAKVSTLQGQLAEANRTDRSVPLARALIASDVITQMERGAAFGPELDGLARLGVAPDRLAALRPLAVDGAPTMPALAQEFAGMAERLTVIDATEADRDLLDRFLASLKHLVRIRPLAGGGDDPQAVVSSIASALARGDASAALAAWHRLPPVARQSSSAWASKLEARVAAAEAARALFLDSVRAVTAAQASAENER